MKRTGNSKLAVVGWGRGMGHTGHMYLADAVITQAADMKADPYFFVSKTVGKDDPLFPEEKLSIYQTVFPQQKNIFTAEGNLNQALQELANLGYQGVVLVVGADQKESFKYLEKPNKEGVPVYQSFGFKKLKVISRQETRSKFRGEEGPRATPMREILLNPDATDEQKYEVWRRDMPSALSDDQVMDLMTKAATRLTAPKAAKLKESRIIDPKALINAFYVSPRGDRHRVAEKIPYYLLDKLVPLLTKKYAITMKDIEVRPADHTQYTRTSQPDLAEGWKGAVAGGIAGGMMGGIPGAVIGTGIGSWLGDKGQRSIEAHQAKVRDFSNATGINTKVITSVIRYKKLKDIEVYDSGDSILLAAMYSIGSNGLINAAKFTKALEEFGFTIDEVEVDDTMFDDIDILIKSLNEIIQSTLQHKQTNKKMPTDSDGRIEPTFEDGMTRRGILKGIGAAGLAGVADKASAIAGAFPSPSTRQKWANDAAASNRAEAARQAELQRQANAARASKLAADTKDVERLNKVNFHGKDAPKPTNAEWDGDSDFLDLDGTQYAKASRMPITGDEPSDMELISTKEGRQVYIWTRRSLKGTHGRYFYPAEKPNTINEFASSDNSGGDDEAPGSWDDFIRAFDPEIKKLGFGMDKRSSHDARIYAHPEAQKGIMVRQHPERDNVYFKLFHFFNQGEDEAGLADLSQNGAASVLVKVEDFLSGQQELSEFAPGNGDDDDNYAEFVVYQCDTNDQFEFIGGPLYQSDNLGMAHKYAYEHFLRYRPKAFVVYQPHKEASRGNYGVKGESDSEEDLTEGSQVERKIARVQAMIQDFHNRAKATKNDIKKNHYLQMADQLQSELDRLINDANEMERDGNMVAQHDSEASDTWNRGGLEEDYLDE